MVSRMPIITKKKLLHKVIESIKNSGWNVYIPEGLNHPLRLIATKDDEREKMLVYIWNVSHGGKTRSKEEYRIQFKGIKPPLEIKEDQKTLVLGWYEESKVFVGYNPHIHKVFGFSPSLQVRKSKLEEASRHGMAFQSKPSRKAEKEIVVTFKPEYMMRYILSAYSEYHNQESVDFEEKEIKIISEKPFDRKIDLSHLEGLSQKRKRVLQKINKAVRDERFRKIIYHIYRGKCAICGLQAKLTESAHIIPVGEKGTDEPQNGILLCRNHHKAYDNGLIVIDENYTIRLNSGYVENLKKIRMDSELKKFVEQSRINEKIFLPKDKKYYPKKKYLKESISLK